MLGVAFGVSLGQPAAAWFTGACVAAMTIVAGLLADGGPAPVRSTRRWACVAAGTFGLWTFLGPVAIGSSGFLRGDQVALGFGLAWLIGSADRKPVLALAAILLFGLGLDISTWWSSTAPIAFPRVAAGLALRAFSLLAIAFEARTLIGPSMSSRQRISQDALADRLAAGAKSWDDWTRSLQQQGLRDAGSEANGPEDRPGRRLYRDFVHGESRRRLPVAIRRG